MTGERQASEDTLNRLFTSLDSDSNGLIDENEFSELLKRLGGDNPAEVESLEFALIDADGDGLVAFNELVDWWLDRNLDV